MFCDVDHLVWGAMHGRCWSKSIHRHHATRIPTHTGEHGLLLHIGTPTADAVRIDVGGLFPPVLGSDGSPSKGRGVVAVWSRVYDAQGGNLREAVLFQSSSS